MPPVGDAADGAADGAAESAANRQTDALILAHILHSLAESYSRYGVASKADRSPAELLERARTTLENATVPAGSRRASEAEAARARSRRDTRSRVAWRAAMSV